MPFSNLSVRRKFLMIDVMVVLAVILTWVTMLSSISKTKEEKYKQMEMTAITASDQMLNVSLENAFSIAKNIYTNEAMYEFLNTEYPSSAAYYEAYYPLQRNTAMNISDISIVKNCTIYTSNPTILTGGDLKQLGSAVGEYWYQAFMKIGKPIILCIDPDNGSMKLVRKLDYIDLDTGDSFLCIELNTDEIAKLADNIGFDGELYIMSGSNLIYSSDKSAKTADDIDIKPDFECVTRNYYTTDIEFYSCSSKTKMKDFLAANKVLLTGLLIVVVLVVFTGKCMSINIRRRVKPVLSEFRATGYVQSARKEKNGRDEIGRIIDICCDMSERLRLKGSEFELSSDSLMRKSSDYESLFATAMRLDAELAVNRLLPDIRIDLPDEYFPLSVESTLLRRTADKFGARYVGDQIDRNDKWLVPAYSLVLLAEDFFQHFGADTIEVSAEDDSAVIVFRSDKRPRSTDILKLNAVFEEDEVSNDYSFDRNYRFNPYLRIKHCLGSNISLIINDKNKFNVIFTISFNSGSEV